MDERVSPFFFFFYLGFGAGASSVKDSGGVSIGVWGVISSVVTSSCVEEFCRDLFMRASTFSPGLFEIIRVAVTARAMPAIIPILTSLRIFKWP